MHCCLTSYTALLWLEASAAVCKEDSTSDALGQTNTYGTQALSSGCAAFRGAAGAVCTLKKAGAPPCSWPARSSAALPVQGYNSTVSGSGDTAHMMGWRVSESARSWLCSSMHLRSPPGADRCSVLSTLMSCAARASPSGVAASSRSVSRRSICACAHSALCVKSLADGPVVCRNASVAW
jgi:hypothetical protein